MTLEEARSVLAALIREKVEFVVIGSMAMAAQGLPRVVPVRKYRSVADMPAVRPLPPLDPGNLGVACELTELTFALHPWKLDPGVCKYRSVDEAQRSRRAPERQQVRRRVS